MGLLRAARGSLRPGGAAATHQHYLWGAGQKLTCTSPDFAWPKICHFRLAEHCQPPFFNPWAASINSQPLQLILYQGDEELLVGTWPKPPPRAAHGASVPLQWPPARRAGRSASTPRARWRCWGSRPSTCGSSGAPAATRHRPPSPTMTTATWSRNTGRRARMSSTR